MQTDRTTLRQRTLKTSIHCTGTGLHSGAKVSMTLQPAEPGTGIVFRRTDIVGGGAEIRASWRNVVDTKLCTMIGNAKGVTVGTIEHLMAAFYGGEIDNAVVEINGPEVPIMDGSAQPFVFLIECAGSVEQDAPRRAIEVRRLVTVEDGRRTISLRPSSSLSIDFEIDFENALPRQACSLSLDPATFRMDVSRARTFGFAHEVAQLRAAGLARGGSLDNAIVIGKNRSILNKDGLRFEDEFVRHKVLDCVGDLYLAGAPILGSVRCVRSGHRLNNLLLRALFEQRDAWRFTTMTADAAEPMTVRHRRAPVQIAVGD